MTHYQTLGVPNTASPDDIKKAFRVLAGKHHPDKGGDEEQFKKINQAHDVLKNPQTRNQYDAELQFGHQGGPFRAGSGARGPFGGNYAGPGGVHFGFSDDGMNAGGFADGSFPEDIANLFRQMHEGRDPNPNMHTKQRDKRNRDVRIRMSVSLESLLEVQSKTINVQTPEGPGEALYVTIPVSARNGTKIKYPGLGDNMFKSIPRGDLYIEIAVDNHPNFVYNNDDLHTQIEIDSFTAVTGGEKEIVGLDGNRFMLKIPPGTQHGAKSRIPTQGLYRNNHKDTRGDLYIITNVITPTLTEEQIRSVKDLAKSFK
jgi:curved DNA-binding protein